MGETGTPPGLSVAGSRAGTGKEKGKEEKKEEKGKEEKGKGKGKSRCGARRRPVTAEHHCCPAHERETRRILRPHPAVCNDRQIECCPISTQATGDAWSTHDIEGTGRRLNAAPKININRKKVTQNLRNRKR